MITIDQKWREMEIGDGVTAEIRPLNIGSYHQAIGLMLKHSTDGNNNEMSRALMADPDMLPIIKEIVPENIRNIKGVEVQDADGNVRGLEPADLCEFGACMGFAITALAKLIEVSQLTGTEIKNSKGRRPTP